MGKVIIRDFEEACAKAIKTSQEQKQAKKRKADEEDLNCARLLREYEEAKKNVYDER